MTEPFNWFEIVEEDDGAWIKDGEGYIYGPYSKSESEALNEYRELLMTTNQCGALHEQMYCTKPVLHGGKHRDDMRYEEPREWSDG